MDEGLSVSIGRFSMVSTLRCIKQTHVRSLYNRRVISCVFLLGMASMSHAEVTPKAQGCRAACCGCIMQVEPRHHWYLDTNIGRSFDYAHNNLKLTFNTPIPETVTFSTTDVPYPPFFSAALGYTWFNDNDNAYLPFWSLGLKYRYTVPLLILGDLNLSPSPLLATQFGYEVAQQSFLVEGKLDLYRWEYVMPYVALGLGVSLAGTDSPEIGPGLITFAPIQINTGFSYSLGLGLDFPLKTNFWLSLGYSYEYFGVNKERLSPVSNPNISVLVRNKSLHAQNVQFGVRYLFA